MLEFFKNFKLKFTLTLKNLVNKLTKLEINLGSISLFIGVLVTIGLVIYDTNNKDAPQWLYMTAVGAAVAFLKDLKDDLQNIKEHGLPVPVSYVEDIGFDWVFNTTTEKKIYVGFINDNIIDNLLKKPHANTHFIINMHSFSNLEPRVRSDIFNNIGNSNLILSNTPKDSVAVFEYSKGLCESASFIRKTLDSDCTYYCIKHSKNNVLLKQISDQYKLSYMENLCITVESKSLLNFIPTYYTERDIFNISSLKNGGKRYTFYHREEFFDRSINIITGAQSSIMAIDLTPFHNWNNDEVFRNYILSHKRDHDLLTKQRVKVCDFSKESKESLECIKTYIATMAKIGVELRFCNLKPPANERGAVIIDDESCIDFDQPIAGSKYGTISFLQNDIKNNNKRFNSYWEKGVEPNTFVNGLEVS